MSSRLARTGRASNGWLSLTLFFLLAVAPVVYGLAYAFAYSLGLTGLLSEGPTVRHWAVLFSGAEVVPSILWSLYVALASVAGTVAVSLTLALVGGSRLRRGLPSYALYVPLALPAIVLAFFVFHLLSGAGTVGRLALAIGVIDRPEQFPSPVHDVYGAGIILAHLIVTVPYFILFFTEIHGMEQVSMLRAQASTLGAGRLASLYRVEIPILLRRARTNLLLLFLSVLGAYEIPLLLGRQSPEMLSVLAMRKLNLYDLSARPEAFVVAIVYAAIAFGVLAVLLRLRREES